MYVHSNVCFFFYFSQVQVPRNNDKKWKQSNKTEWTASEVVSSNVVLIIEKVMWTPSLRDRAPDPDTQPILISSCPSHLTYFGPVK